MNTVLISKAPKYKREDIYRWADYIELLCLINKDSALSQNDFIDRLKPKSDLEDSEDFSKDKNNAEVNEEKGLLAEDCFRLIEYRISAFQKYYPFKLSADSKVISRKKTLNDKQKFYLSLLFSSLLGPLKIHQAKLTSSFELLSHQALKSIMPPKSKSYIFGSSNIEEIKDEKVKSAKLWSKINELAVNIRERVLIEETALSKYDNGDGGLDIYGWLDLGDKNPHVPLYFSQCACTPEWTTKQNSSKFDRWNNFISLSIYPLNIIFIPFSFRSANGEWHKYQKIEKTIVMDRERIVHCLGGNLDIFLKSKSSKVVEEVLKFKEGTV